MKFTEKRHFIRHPVSFPISYKVIDKELTENGHSQSETINLSLGGLLFPSKNPIEPNAEIMIKMPFEDKVFDIKGEVVRCVRNSETKFFDIAVNFVKAQEAFKAKMIEQVYLISGYRDMLSVRSGKEISLEEASRKWIKRYSEKFGKLYW